MPLALWTRRLMVPPLILITLFVRRFLWPADIKVVNYDKYSRLFPRRAVRRKSVLLFLGKEIGGAGRMVRLCRRLTLAF